MTKRGAFFAVSALASFGLILSGGCKKKKYQGPSLEAAWRSSPEDLPYKGKMPVVKQVSFNMRLVAEKAGATHGSGSVTPYFSSEKAKHLQSTGHSTRAFKWSVDAKGQMTFALKGSKATCKGKVDGDAVVIQVKGCPALAEHVAVPSVRFARRGRIERR